MSRVLTISCVCLLKYIFPGGKIGSEARKADFSLEMNPDYPQNYVDAILENMDRFGSKYNGKYILGNLFVCGDCGVSYRRRTERGKVGWRSATRIEKGKEACPNSPTLDKRWIQDTLSKSIYRNGAYDESIIRNEVDKIQIFDAYIQIYCTDRLQEKRLFQND